MRHRIDSLGVEVTRAESEKFATPLLLLHGLWTGAWLWHRMAGFLGHRGWESWAPDLFDPAAAPARVTRLDRVTPGDLVARCGQMIAAMPAPPVVIAHDAGAALALRVARAFPVRALVLLSPVLPGSGALRAVLGSLPRVLRAIYGRPLDPPRADMDRVFYAGIAPETAAVIRGRLVPQPGRIAYDLLRGRFDAAAVRPVPPTLIVAGTGDAVLPAAAASRLAVALGGEHVVVPGAHWLPIEATWRDATSRVHRWMVRCLGAPLLLFRDEEEAGEEP
jgi:pimeloyl-ACP methyl ester carboxylesterase